MQRETPKVVTWGARRGRDPQSQKAGAGVTGALSLGLLETRASTARPRPSVSARPSGLPVLPQLPARPPRGRVAQQAGVSGQPLGARGSAADGRAFQGLPGPRAAASSHPGPHGQQLLLRLRPRARGGWGGPGPPWGGAAARRAPPDRPGLQGQLLGHLQPQDIQTATIRKEKADRRPGPPPCRGRDPCPWGCEPPPVAVPVLHDASQHPCPPGLAAPQAVGRGGRRPWAGPTPVTRSRCREAWARGRGDSLKRRSSPGVWGSPCVKFPSPPSRSITQSSWGVGWAPGLGSASGCSSPGCGRSPRPGAPPGLTRSHGRPRPGASPDVSG